jgi:transposase
LGVRAFCQQHQISEPLFYAWRRTLQERDRQAAATPQPDAPAFVPVTIVAPTPPLELVLASGRVVRISAGFDAATLRQLLAVLDEDPSC